MQMERLSGLDEELYPARSQHRQEIERYYDNAPLRPFTVAEKQFLGQIDLFLVAFSNRSGSTLLTEVLNQAGFGVPPKSEVFNSEVALHVCREYQSNSFSDYLFSTVEGWHREQLAGFKIGPRQLFWLAEVGFLSLFRSLRIINPCRRDVVAQAVSFYIAGQTGQWQSEMALQRPIAELEYSAQEILQCLRIIHSDQQLIEYFLNIHGVDFRRMYYEDLVTGPDAELAEIASFLGPRSPKLSAVKLGNVGIQRQATSKNTEFADRFRADFDLWSAPASQARE